jgi:hypothetical protein
MRPGQLRLIALIRMNMYSFILLFGCAAIASDAAGIQADAVDDIELLSRKSHLASLLLSTNPTGARARHGGPQRGEPQHSQSNKGVQLGKPSRRDALALGAPVLGALLGAPHPASAYELTFQQEAQVFADALIPIVKDLKAKQVAPLAGKAVGAAVTGDPKEIVKTINLFLDVFLSIPPQEVFLAAKLLKEGTAAAAKAEKCNLICLPPKEKTEEVARAIADAVTFADAGKLNAFLKQAGLSFKSGDPAKYAAATGDLAKYLLAANKNDIAKAKEALSELLKSVERIEVVKEVKKEDLPSPGLYTANGRLEVIAEDLAEALYPLVASVKADDIGPFASKLVELGATGDPKEIIKTLDAGLDAVLSVPPDRVYTALSSFKEAIAEAVDAKECNLICVAPKAVVQKFARDAATALSVADPVKLQAFLEQFLKSLGTGDKLMYGAVALEGAKFLKTLNPQDVELVKIASLDVLKSSGSNAYKLYNWGLD